MPHSIVCSSPTENGGYDSFLHQEHHPEPCSLAREDFQYQDRSEWRSRRLLPSHVTTDEPRLWVDILFEPGDILEVRIIPPRSVAEAMLPRKFMQTQTSLQHEIYRWAFADEVEVLINTLTELNRGNATWWGVWNKCDNRWADVEGEAGIPLNIYASANPRMVTGLSKNEDVLLARSLFVDLDKTTLEAAMQKLAKSGLPLPTMIVISGHGVHFYWRLLEAITDLKCWTALQKRLIQLLGSDPAIHDPSRPMRIPGFMNVNGETPTRCYIHEADGSRRYSLDDILPILPPEPPKPARENISQKQSSNIDAETLSIQGEAADIRHRAEAYSDRFQPVEENRNSTAFKRAAALVENFDLDAEDVLPLMENVNDKANNPLDADELEQVVDT